MRNADGWEDKEFLKTSTLKKLKGELFMETTNNEKMAFELILHAGNAKSKAMEAIYASREKDFEEAEKDLKEAEKELNEAHKCQTAMLVGEANGEKLTMDVLLVHALDHLSMATVTLELSEELVLQRKEMKGEN